MDWLLNWMWTIFWKCGNKFSFKLNLVLNDFSFYEQMQIVANELFNHDG